MKWIKLVSLFLLFSHSFSAYSQYYYTDIVTMQAAAKQYAALVSAHIKQVSAISFEGNKPVDNFKLNQRISPDFRTITITSSDPSTGYLSTINYYNINKLIQTRDSSSNVLNITKYSYDSDGNISTIVTTSDDAFMNSHSTEMHEWIYDGNKPKKMLRIKDKTDTTIVSFTYDGGNVAQETWTRKGHVAETYYYYYNSNNQLTDIVRFNIRIRKMLPDFLFEYGEEGHIAQMTQMPNGSTNYLVWKYTYNSNGLKEKELLFNKQQQLVGRVEYKYE
ncbi:MAG: hypothetical protein M3R72_12415 [Bacteroidota bacterium]|nr:hypothetical protein [Bacteroidota bacterium]